MEPGQIALWVVVALVLVLLALWWADLRWRALASISLDTAAFAAMTGAAWMPVEPVPICPTRFPEKSTPSCGHCPV